MPQLSVTIRRIQEGNEHLREEYITSQKEYIRSFASFVCHKNLDWHNDDELSVSLMAFNRAIDTFDPALGNSFMTYARVLIRNSLVDYFRSQQQGKEQGNICTEELTNNNEVAASLGRYSLHSENLERVYEIEIFKENLQNCGLTLEELVKQSPRHRDTRENLKNIVFKVAGHKTILERCLKDKRLPIGEIQSVSGANRKILEKWRKYLLSLLIIAAHGELEMLTEYIWGKELR